MTPPTASAATSRAPAVPAATRTTKTKRGILDKLNARAIATRDWAAALATMLGGAIAATKDHPNAKLLAVAEEEVDMIKVHADALSTALLALHKVKWAPPKKRSATDWQPGDQVALKPKHAKKYEAAFMPSALANLVVVSIHGGDVKIGAAQKDGTSPAMVGLVSRRWLKRCPAAK